MMLLEEIRCRSCRRLLAVGPKNQRAWCDTLCADDFSATEAEGRDALIEAIFHHRGVAKAALGREFGIARQRVDQILDSRMLG